MILPSGRSPPLLSRESACTHHPPSHTSISRSRTAVARRENAGFVDIVTSAPYVSPAHAITKPNLRRARRAAHTRLPAGLVPHPRPLMSNGESLDGFVFPPFIPTASTRPAVTPPAVPHPSVQEPAPAAEPAEAAGRMTMPWDLETPIVRQDDAAPAATQSSAADDEDLPWLEVPTPREAEAPAAEAPPAGDEAFPEWLAWDQRDGIAAEAEARDTVAPIAGLEDFVPMDELGGGFVAPPPAAEWAPAENDASPFDAEPVAGFEAAPPPAFDAVPAFETPPAFGSAEAEPLPELVFDDVPSADHTPAEAAPAEEWSLAAPEAAEPPALYDAPPPPFEASPAAAAPSFEVSLDDGALSIEPAEAPSFLADEEPMFAPEPAPAAAAPQPFAWDDEPVTASDRQPFVADEEAVLASEPEPFGADAEAVLASEPEPFMADDNAVIAAAPDPFTAAAVAEAEAIAPAAAADSPFDDVAARLEGIARMLRERPDELLAGGSSDPLALLVTGYVMGYTARGGR